MVLLLNPGLCCLLAEHGDLLDLVLDLSNLALNWIIPWVAFSTLSLGTFLVLKHVVKQLLQLIDFLHGVAMHPSETFVLANELVNDRKQH